MYKNKTILGLIPARGGSKGLPRKNIKTLLGKPLIAWSIEQAINSKHVDYIYVSTEDNEIAEISKDFGAEIPFMRPENLAKDSTSTIDVVYHVIDEFKSIGKHFDIVALLEPTSPLRKKNDLDLALEKLIESWNEADSIVGLGEIQLESPFVAQIIQDKYLKPFVDSSKKIKQRQEYPKVYFPYGVIYATKTEVLLKEGTFYPKKTIPYFLERWQNYEVDDYCDFLCTETIMQGHKELIR